jgi:DNA-3-methyladenine glycosylase II
MSDEEVIRHITQVKGIGRWSAEMFLIFHLLRPDVFPADDLGLQKAIRVHYGKEPGKRPAGRVSPELRPLRSASRREQGHIISLWQPYRTVATWYLWRSLDPVPVEY